MPVLLDFYALEDETLQHRIAHEVSLDDLVKGHELIERGGFGGGVIVTIN